MSVTLDWPCKDTAGPCDIKLHVSFTQQTNAVKNHKQQHAVYAK